MTKFYHFFFKIFCQFQKLPYLCSAIKARHLKAKAEKAEGLVPSSIG